MAIPRRLSTFSSQLRGNRVDKSGKRLTPVDTYFAISRAGHTIHDRTHTPGVEEIQAQSHLWL